MIALIVAAAAVLIGIAMGHAKREARRAECKKFGHSWHTSAAGVLHCNHCEDYPTATTVTRGELR